MLASVLEIVGMFLFLLVPALIYKQWWLAGVFLIFGLCFGIVELLAVKFSGMTISQHFWSLIKTNKVEATYIIIAMAIAFTLLLVHLRAR